MNLPQPLPWGIDPSFVEAFKDPDVVSLYDRRPPYPPEIFETLLSLLPEGSSPAVLELGPGTGEIARAIAPHVARVDAVDASQEMLNRAARMPGGYAGNIRWIVGRA